MVTWTELRHERPDIAEPGLLLLYPPHISVGLAYLATVRPDGGPRLHPMCPIVNDRGLFALIVPGPKCNDLRRDGRYALHSFPTDDNEDAFYLTGRATAVTDHRVHEALVAQFLEERSAIGLSADDVAGQVPFSFDVSTAMLTATSGHGDPRPRHVIWHAPGGAAQVAT